MSDGFWARGCVDEQFYRPYEFDTMRGDASKAYAVFGWRAQTTLEQLCQMMMQENLRRAE
ncbi:GDP-mannose 4,6-dehydratase [Methylococcus mesophilus]|uniref:GDP-mannose 4,6-dehydratase n=1 Tax=Methylococcus mesophilus TaxID=2993564 RepID=UPI0037424B30